MGNSLSEHPEFSMMLIRTLECFRCTLAEVREDYWLGRAWRSLTTDPLLRSHIARVGVGNVLITGTGFTAVNGRSRQRLRRAVEARLLSETGRTVEGLNVNLLFAEEPIAVAQGCVWSLLAQTVAGDDRWTDLSDYATDLAPIVLPVAFRTERVVAA